MAIRLPFWMMSSTLSIYHPWRKKIPKKASEILRKKVQSSARAFALLLPINVARSLVFPFHDSSLSDLLLASWSFSNPFHSRDCSFSSVSCLFSDRRHRNTLPPPPLHSGPPLHCFLSPLCSSSSPATLISILLPPPLPLPLTPLSYVAPEYACTGMLTEKSDVYSFGILIMEIITVRSPADYSKPQGEVNLIEWLKAMVDNRKSEELIDLNLLENPSSKALKLCSVGCS
ncbi:hypothetical protein HN51_054895 [Arachis hypogaea]